VEIGDVTGCDRDGWKKAQGPQAVAEEPPAGGGVLAADLFYSRLPLIRRMLSLTPVRGLRGFRLVVGSGGG
jgi:hypothetical protein